MNFFTADLHLGSNEILTRENRPFKDMNDFKNYFISIWNKQVKEGDVLWVVGDFVNYNNNYKLSREEVENVLAIVKRINCSVILLIGNGEERILRDLYNDDFEQFCLACKEVGFYDVKRDTVIEMQGRQFYCNHYPRNHRKNMVNLFAHTHRATGLWKPYGLNVGCDLNHFRLFSETEIFRLLEMKEKWWDTDIDNMCME